jgi:large subunit ribosomal protein L28
VTQGTLRAAPPIGYHRVVARVIRAPPKTTHHHALLPRARDVIDDSGDTVAANCDVCGKGPGFGHSISHSHIRTKRRWNPNIQRVRAVVAGTPKRVNVCTSCLKAGKVQRRSA